MKLAAIETEAQLLGLRGKTLVIDSDSYHVDEIIPNPEGECRNCERGMVLLVGPGDRPSKLCRNTAGKWCFAKDRGPGENCVPLDPATVLIV